MGGSREKIACSLWNLRLCSCVRYISAATELSPKAPYASDISAACRLVQTLVTSGPELCAASRLGISAKTPIPNNTGEANAPRNLNRDQTPTAKYIATSVHAANVVASYRFVTGQWLSEKPRLTMAVVCRSKARSNSK